MLERSEHSKREALATELADVLLRQRAIVEAAASLAGFFQEGDKEIFETMMQEDEKSLRMIDTVINNYGLRVEPKPFTQKFSKLCLETITNPLSLELERLTAFKLLKQDQYFSGHLIHKASQLAEMDVKEAIGMFEGVQSVFTSHSNQVEEWCKTKGVEMIMGESPAGGLVGMARDLTANAFGKVLSQVGKPAEEMSVLTILRLDHHKVLTIFKEIQAAETQEKAFDLFIQLRADLSAHAEAEELIVYKHFQRYVDLREQLEDSWSEHEDMRELLEAISKNSDPLIFKQEVQELQQIVKAHIDEEEGEVFSLFQQKAKGEDLVRLAGEFSQVKKMIQERGNSPSQPLGSPPPSPKSESSDTFTLYSLSQKY